MPVSRYEEPGVNSHARHSSDSVAGVPIKKRRFPLVRSPSPPLEAPSSPSVEPDLPQKEQSNSKPESAFSNAGGPTEVSGNACIGNNSSLEEKGEHSANRIVNLVQSNVNPPGINLKGKALSLAASSGAEMGSNEKFTLADKSALLMIRGNTELQLASNEHLIPQIGKNISGEGELMTNDKSNFSRIPENTKLLLAPKESLVQALAGQKSEGGCEEQVKLDPYSWKLGLTEGQNSSKSNVAELKMNCTHQCTKRLHWDLNTMMDAWEGSVNDVPVANRVGGINEFDAAGMHDIKPTICSKEIVLNEPEGMPVSSGKKIPNKSEHSSKMSCLPTPGQHFKSEDLLHLRLSPSSGLQSGLSQELSNSPIEADSRSVLSNLSISETLVLPAGCLNLVNLRSVKSEPFVEGSKQESRAKSPLKLGDRIIKPEPVQGYPEEFLNSSDIRNMKLVDNRAVKSESVYGGNQETVKTMEGISTQSEHHIGTAEVPFSGKLLHRSDGPTFTPEMPITGEVSHPLEFPIMMGLFNSGEVSPHSVFHSCTEGMPITGKVAQEVSEIVDSVATDLVSGSVGSDSKKLKVADGMLTFPITEGLNVAGPESSRLNSKDELHVDSYGNGEVAESDEEKVNISVDEEFSYDSEDESDGNHAAGGVMDTEDKQHGSEDDDYEDGEVREPLVHRATEGGVYAEGEAEHVDYGESDNRDTNLSSFPIDDRVTTSSPVEDRDTKLEGPGETKNAHCSECDNIQLTEKNDQDISKMACLQESLAVEVPTTGTGKKKPIKAARRKPLDRTGREDCLKGCEMELASDVSLNASQGTATRDDPGDTVSQQDCVKRTNQLESSCSFLSKTEPSGNGDETAKDVNNKGNRSRIINLPQASNGSSPGRMRPIPGRSLPLRTERERFTGVVFRGGKIHPRGSRDESYKDGLHKFERDRNQDLPGGSTGSDFMLSRGRVDNRLGTLHGDWDSGCEFALEHYNSPTGFRFPRSKNAAAVTASKVECSSLIIARDGTAIGAGRGGRKPLNDELPNFRHPPSRNSPGGRGGPVPRGQMVRRPPRDISPDRCIGGGAPDLVGLRREEKFIRSLPDDMMDPAFKRPQPQYERVDDPFVQGDMSFLPIQRRVPLHIPRNRSKSPRSRTRSPGPWQSPRRRSPDGFGHPELIHRRSPPIYRMERMRSPHQRPCFAEDMVGRRHVSPPYMSRLCNDMRDMGSARERDHPRSFISNRSSSGRILPRSTRRFNMIDPRERTESDEYFGGPMHSVRFHELGGDGGNDEGRKCSERRGPVRSFRAPYNGDDVENFRFHVEDGPRPYRFFPEADSEFHVRDNLREREFDRRIKNRPETTLRRTRSVEEQEENYWHGQQGWHDDGFDDVSHVKRRRF